MEPKAVGVVMHGSVVFCDRGRHLFPLRHKQVLFGSVGRQGLGRRGINLDMSG